MSVRAAVQEFLRVLDKGPGYPGDFERAIASLRTALAAEERTLFDTDAFCPHCGHNRDKSSVSSIDLGNGREECQMCHATWLEIAAHSQEREK